VTSTFAPVMLAPVLSATVPESFAALTWATEDRHIQAITSVRQTAQTLTDPERPSILDMVSPDLSN
jgi:hypothetical protein